MKRHRDQSWPVTTPAVDARMDSSAAHAVTGIIPPIPTPFLHGRVDHASVERLLDHLGPSTDGVLVGGSTGEAASLTVEEREQVIRTVARALGPSRFLVVSVADNAIENSRRLADVAGEYGAALVVVSCPNYFPNDRAMLVAYLDAVASFAGADLCLYDNPIASNTILSVDDLAAVARAVPRLTHIKLTDTARGKADEIVERTPLSVFAGDDSVLWQHVRAGAVGVMTAVPMIHPERSARMWRAFATGDAERAYDEYVLLTHFIHVGLTAADYPQVVKLVLHERGVIASPEVRLPLLPLDVARRTEITAALDYDA